MEEVKACDSHFHLFGGPEFPLAPGSAPLDATRQGTVTDLLAVFSAHGISHGLAVGAQPYYGDNSCLVAGLAEACGRMKGVALVNPSIEDAELERLADAGVIGIRRTPTVWGLREFTESGARRLLDRIAELGWLLELHVEREGLLEVLPFIERAPLIVVIDHFGRPDLSAGTNQPGFAALLELGRRGRAIAKLSGPFRVSRTGPPYEDADPFIEAVIEAFTLDNCVWGSDWPFTGVARRIDYGPQLACLQRWLPDATDRHKVLWTNPARLFGFE